MRVIKHLQKFNYTGLWSIWFSKWEKPTWGGRGRMSLTHVYQQTCLMTHNTDLGIITRDPLMTPPWEDTTILLRFNVPERSSLGQNFLTRSNQILYHAPSPVRMETHIPPPNPLFPTLPQSGFPVIHTMCDLLLQRAWTLQPDHHMKIIRLRKWNSVQWF